MDTLKDAAKNELERFNLWVEREYACATRDEVAWMWAGWQARASGLLHCLHCVDDEMSPGEKCPGIVFDWAEQHKPNQ